MFQTTNQWKCQPSPQGLLHCLSWFSFKCIGARHCKLIARDSKHLRCFYVPKVKCRDAEMNGKTVSTAT